MHSILVPNARENPFCSLVQSVESMFFGFELFGELLFGLVTIPRRHAVHSSTGWLQAQCNKVLFIKWFTLRGIVTKTVTQRFLDQLYHLKYCLKAQNFQEPYDFHNRNDVKLLNVFK